MGAEGNVVPLGTEPVAAETPTTPRPRIGRLHGLAIMGMALSALLGIFSTLAFVTVTWPSELGRYVVAVIAFSVVGFISSALIAVFSAARDTYVRSDKETKP